MTIDQFNEVLDMIRDGKSLRKSCLDLGYCRASFHILINNDSKLLDQYARARDERADVLFEEIIEIADTTEEGCTITSSDKGIFETKGDMLGHRKLKIDARKWMLGKMSPKKYSDKTIVESINRNINQEVTAKTDAEIKALAKKLRDDI